MWLGIFLLVFITIILVICYFTISHYTKYADKSEKYTDPIANTELISRLESDIKTVTQESFQNIQNTTNASQRFDVWLNNYNLSNDTFQKDTTDKLSFVEDEFKIATVSAQNANDVYVSSLKSNKRIQDTTAVVNGQLVKLTDTVNTTSKDFDKRLGIISNKQVIMEEQLDGMYDKYTTAINDNVAKSDDVLNGQLRQHEDALKQIEQQLKNLNDSLVSLKKSNGETNISHESSINEQHDVAVNVQKSINVAQERIAAVTPLLNALAPTSDITKFISQKEIDDTYPQKEVLSELATKIELSQYINRGELRAQYVKKKVLQSISESIISINSLIASISTAIQSIVSNQYTKYKDIEPKALEALGTDELGKSVLEIQGVSNAQFATVATYPTTYVQRTKLGELMEGVTKVSVVQKSANDLMATVRTITNTLTNLNNSYVQASEAAAMSIQQTKVNDIRASLDNALKSMSQLVITASQIIPVYVSKTELMTYALEKTGAKDLKIQLDNTNADLKKLSDRLSSFEGRGLVLPNQVDALVKTATGSDALKQTLQALTSIASSLTSSIANLEKTLVPRNELPKLVAYGARAQELEAAVQSNQASITSNTQQIQDIRALDPVNKDTAIKLSMAAIGGDAFKTDLKKVNDNVTALNTRLTTLQNTLISNYMTKDALTNTLKSYVSKNEASSQNVLKRDLTSLTTKPELDNVNKFAASYMTKTDADTLLKKGDMPIFLSKSDLDTSMANANKKINDARGDPSQWCVNDVCLNNADFTQLKMRYKSNDCLVSEWGAWSACSKPCGSGVRSRTRNITQDPRFGGKACPALREEEACNTQGCPVDCQVSAWSACDTNGNRSRTIATPPLNGGKACPLVMQEGPDTSGCRVDCQVSNWTDWGPCNLDTGLRTRTRTITRQPQNGGASCPALSETTTCAVDCQVSDWSGYGSCNQDTGLRTRTRSITRQPRNGGASCPTLTDTTTCPVDCSYDWGNGWGSCNVSCGGGTMYNYPRIFRNPRNGGASCPGPQTSSCNTQACVNQYKSWIQSWAPWRIKDGWWWMSTDGRTYLALRISNMVVTHYANAHSSVQEAINIAARSDGYRPNWNITRFSNGFNLQCCNPFYYVDENTYVYMWNNDQNSTLFRWHSW